MAIVECAEVRGDILLDRAGMQLPLLDDYSVYFKKMRRVNRNITCSIIQSSANEMEQAGGRKRKQAEESSVCFNQ